MISGSKKLPKVVINTVYYIDMEIGIYLHSSFNLRSGFDDATEIFTSRVHSSLKFSLHFSVYLLPRLNRAIEYSGFGTMSTFKWGQIYKLDCFLLQITTWFIYKLFSSFWVNLVNVYLVHVCLSLCRWHNPLRKVFCFSCDFHLVHLAQI